MPYAVYVNILAILVFTLGHLKFAVTESEKTVFTTKNIQINL